MAPAPADAPCLGGRARGSGDGDGGPPGLSGRVVRTVRHRRRPRGVAPRPARRVLPGPAHRWRAVGQAVAGVRLAAPGSMITTGYLARHSLGRRGMTGV